MISLSDLTSFLVEAKKNTYASGNKQQEIKEVDGSTTLVFKKDSWTYHDNYFGGEPYGGREVVFFEGKVVYIMTYYGWVYQEVEDIQTLYKILQGALSNIPQENPYRGPEEFVKDNYCYRNSFSGDMTNFLGEETISYCGREIYKAHYMGGLVDQR